MKSDKKRQIIEEVEENRARCKGQKPKLQQMANNTTIHIISIWLIAAIVIFTFGQKKKQRCFLPALKKGPNDQNKLYNELLNTTPVSTIDKMHLQCK